ncbi:MAG: winged helix-turn-helix transcriptional regulator [Clostridiaceae bacterium]|nr:winged helix-turn-helix transcriptional regulator [Clostridiaceae bacterium]MDD6274705.1 metalloregulator ArsR/SmtB family transcription factor [Clostridiaceae bacterium]
MGKSEVLCDCDVIHDDVVAAVRQGMPSDGKITELAEFFKVFGDSTRIRILWALDHAELCVCDIAVLLNMTKSAISHQLRVLRDSKLVKTRRSGKVVYYSLADHHVQEIFEKAVEHLEE